MAIGLNTVNLSPFPVSNTGEMPAYAAMSGWCRVIYRDQVIGSDIFTRNYLWKILGDENDIIAWAPIDPEF